MLMLQECSFHKPVKCYWMTKGHGDLIRYENIFHLLYKMLPTIYMLLDIIEPVCAFESYFHFFRLIDAYGSGIAVIVPSLIIN